MLVIKHEVGSDVWFWCVCVCVCECDCELLCGLWRWCWSSLIYRVEFQCRYVSDKSCLTKFSLLFVIDSEVVYCKWLHYRETHNECFVVFIVNVAVDVEINCIKFKPNRLNSITSFKYQCVYEASFRLSISGYSTSEKTKIYYFQQLLLWIKYLLLTI